MTEKKSAVIAWIIGWIVAVIYITGLAFLVPFAIILLFPPDVFILPPNLVKLTLISAGLVVASAVILMLQKKSMGDALASLAAMTFLVGIIAAILALFGQHKIMSFLGFLGTLKPVAEGYIAYWAFFVPKVWASIAGYFVLGIILWITGNRLRREQHKISWMQKIFGKRVQIFK
ncbi:hypothetical protein KY338_03390 [Candidatus Woesearchaeota archaeon]|nr:hypothetical protein [Candidatus Woesearchaeota archaeon]MBW3005353.1 hypothetical protein [Candidatus Woesearchaeota archaeon]